MDNRKLRGSNVPHTPAIDEIRRAADRMRGFSGARAFEELLSGAAGANRVMRDAFGAHAAIEAALREENRVRTAMAFQPSFQAQLQATAQRDADRILKAIFPGSAISSLAADEYLRRLNREQIQLDAVMDTVVRAINLQGALGLSDAGINLMRHTLTRAVEEAEPDTPLTVAVAGGFSDALVSIAHKVRWDVLLPILISLLLGFWSHLESGASAELNEARFAELSQKLIEMQHLLEVQNTREVRRHAVLRSRPGSHGGPVGTVDPGDLVVVLEQRGKWARVKVLRALDNGGVVAPFGGWMLKKYIKPGQ